MATNRVKSSTGVAAFEKNFQEGVTLKEDECCAEVHETPDGYLMPLEFLQAIATGHPNNVSTADGGRMQLGGMLPLTFVAESLHSPWVTQVAPGTLKSLSAHLH